MKERRNKGSGDSKIELRRETKAMATLKAPARASELERNINFGTILSNAQVVMHENGILLQPQAVKT